MILHSKITPKRPQITPDHTRSSQEHAYFLSGPHQNSNSSLSPSPPQTEGTPPYFKWPFGCCFSFQKWKKIYQWSHLGKIDPKDYRNPYGQWDKTCTTHVVPFSIGEYTFWKNRRCASLILTYYWHLWLLSNSTLRLGPSGRKWKHVRCVRTIVIYSVIRCRKLKS